MRLGGRRRHARLPRPDPRAPARPRAAAAPTRSSSTSTARRAAELPRPGGPRAHRPGALRGARRSARTRFREGALPVLYCSPTMELGVDIAELNAVNLRNVPPTPANYAQRSGRAGRSGQPALVFTYCSTGSPHDQYFFRRPERMVAGGRDAAAARPGQRGPGPRARPRDLAGRDRAEPGQVADATCSTWRASRRAWSCCPTSVQDVARGAGARARAREPRAERVLDDHRRRAGDGGLVQPRLAGRRARPGRPRQFDAGLRPLARPVPRGPGPARRPEPDHPRRTRDPRTTSSQAERLRREAETQLELLTETENFAQSDFYSYRYFASEGFLPGYNFPRLPLSAFIPGRRTRQARDEFLSAAALPGHLGVRAARRRLPRGLALPDQPGDPAGPSEPTSVADHRAAKLCDACGYLHPIAGRRRPRPVRALRRTRSSRRSRTLLPAAERRDPPARQDQLRRGGAAAARLRAPHRRPLRRARTARRRCRRPRSMRTATAAGRADLRPRGDALADQPRLARGAQQRDQFGFVLDIERGYWATQRPDDPDDEDDADALGPRTQRVVPFVEDRRNCLLVEPTEHAGPRR